MALQLQIKDCIHCVVIGALGLFLPSCMWVMKPLYCLKEPLQELHILQDLQAVSELSVIDNSSSA